MKEQRDLVVCSKLLRILDSTYSSNRLSTNYTTIEKAWHSCTYSHVKLDIAPTDIVTRDLLILRFASSVSQRSLYIWVCAMSWPVATSCKPFFRPLFSLNETHVDGRVRKKNTSVCMCDCSLVWQKKKGINMWVTSEHSNISEQDCQDNRRRGPCFFGELLISLSLRQESCC